MAARERSFGFGTSGVAKAATVVSGGDGSWETWVHPETRAAAARATAALRRTVIGASTRLVKQARSRN
jgi:hypothetical protein